MEQNQNIETNEKDYLEEIERLQNETVAKDQYEKLLADNKKLIQTIARNKNREEEQIKEEQIKNIDVDECRKKLFDPNKQLSNLEYVSEALKLREGLIQRGERDPFLPVGTKVYPNKDDIESAQRVADAFQHCVDYADGDSKLFTQELQRITYENGIPNINNRRR